MSKTPSSPPQHILAIDGGRPLREQPMSPWPYYDEEMIEATQRVLRSGKVNYWTGQEGRRFEAEFAESVSARYAVAVSNGTVALELALLALGIGPGDEVILTSRTFVASASSVVLRGATPVFADVDPSSQNITCESIDSVITDRTRAIIAVHLSGWSCEMDSIMELASRHNLKVIEDAAQAHGASYRGKPVGSLGHAAAFSFCQDKIMSTGGEGGMIVTNDESVWKTAWAYKDHGKSWDTVYNQQHAPGFRWLHESFGTNWRMTEMQSAIGRVLLKRLPAWVSRRRTNADRLSHYCAQFPALRLTRPPSHVYHSYYKYYVFVRPEHLAAGWDRDRISNAINAEGVPCFSGSCSEVYLEKAFPLALRPKRRLPVAQSLGESSLMFLVHPTLTDAEVDDTCQAIQRVMSVASTRHTMVA